MFGDGSADQNIMPGGPKLKNGPVTTSPHRGITILLFWVMPFWHPTRCDEQRGGHMRRSVRRVVGANVKKYGNIRRWGNDDRSWLYVVTRELTIPTIIAEFSDEAPVEAEEVPEQAEGNPMGGITRFILRAVGNKDGLNMENVREDEEEGIFYEEDSDMDG